MPLTTAAISTNARAVLDARYLIKDVHGNIIETPDDLFRRVATVVATAEAEADWLTYTSRFYDLLSSLDFLPGSPALGNAGRPLGMLSSCFVVSPDDSLESIYETIKQTALIHQAGGGTGHDFSRLRSSGSVVRSTQGVASGPVSFMRVFDAATDAVKQGGQRRGAMMGTLRVDHPDLDTFLAAKADMVSLQNFNISVLLTDDFMDALAVGGDFAVIDPRTGDVVGRRSAQAVWDILIANAWKNGDPGVLFLDRARASESNPVPTVYSMYTTNPCSEQWLYEYDSCNLGSINLAHFVTADTAGPAVAWTRLAETVQLAVRFLDDVIDANRYPLPQIAEVTRSIRRIGLGIMGWADMLVQLRIPYDSDAALALADTLMCFIRGHADGASARLAEERGTFPLWEQSIYGPTGRDFPLRNACRTNIAPTGTISMIADCSSGIEPYFALSFKRQHRLDRRDPKAVTTLYEDNAYFVAEARARGFYSDDLMGHLRAGGRLADRAEVPADVVALYRTAHDVSPELHVRMAAAFQTWIDNSLSKTANFPHDATIADVDRVYRLAYDLGLKGVTMYRDGSRDLQVLSHEASDTPSRACADTACGGAVYRHDGCYTCYDCGTSYCAA